VPSHTTWHFDKKEAEFTRSKKILWIITSKGWDKHRSPPSLFEYLLATMFRCSIQSPSTELQDEKLGILKFRSKDHKVTWGCIFDFTHRRSSVSIFKLCLDCESKLSLIEKTIKDKCNNVNLVGDINTILSKKWMGTPEKRDSPIYELTNMMLTEIAGLTR